MRRMRVVWSCATQHSATVRLQKFDECWKQCGQPDLFAFECREATGVFPPTLGRCVVPPGCACAPCEPFNCAQCDWGSPAFVHTLTWCRCCAHNCDGNGAACRTNQVRLGEREREREKERETRKGKGN